MQISEYKQQRGNKHILAKELIAGKVIDNTKTFEKTQKQQVEALKHLRLILKNYKEERLKDLQLKVQDSLAEGNT